MVYAGNRWLNREEMTVNAQYIMDYLTGEGWTKNAVAGMLGNMETESTINPAIWQNLDAGNMSLGFGLVQWTPASKYINWANARGYDYETMDSNLQRILYEVDNNIQWISTSEYPMSFAEFTQSTQSPENLASAFLKNYERAGVEVEPERRRQARDWFDTLDGEGVIHFIFPTVERVTSGFRTPERPDHDGVDFAESGYHEIKASAGGVVSRSYVSDSYGEVVMIVHEINGETWETVYAHMRTGSRTVSEGDTVQQGDILGVMGNTGDSRGQHLHFELHKGRWNSNKSNAVDPLDYLGKSSGGGTDPPIRPTDNIIMMLLCDALNGWKH